MTRPLQQGPRVHLVPPRPQDEREYIEAVHDSRALHGSWVSPPGTVEAFEGLLGRAEDPSFEALWVRDNATEDLVGVFNLSQIFRRSFCNAYLGYWATAWFAGTGRMTEGLGLVLDHAFGPLDLHRLEANIQPENEPSRRLVQRAGFRLEGFSPRYLKVDGEWRDHERWAITVEDRATSSG